MQVILNKEAKPTDFIFLSEKSSHITYVCVCPQQLEHAEKFYRLERPGIVVEFKAGGLYFYDGVEREVFERFLTEESAGKFLNEIKGAYECYHLEYIYDGKLFMKRVKTKELVTLNDDQTKLVAVDISKF